MRKREFLRELSERIAHLDKGERDNIINYYDELIEDKIERTGAREEQVIYELGTMNDIIRRLNINSLNNSRKIVADDIFEEEQFEESKEQSAKYDEETKEEQVEKETKVKETSSNNNKGVIILILILTSPIWASLVLGLGCTIAGLLIGAFAVVFAIGITGVALGVAGVAAIILGISLLPTASGFVAIGTGIVLIGLGLIVGVVLGKTKE